MSFRGPPEKRTTLIPDFKSADRWIDIETKQQVLKLCEQATIFLYATHSDPSVGLVRVSTHIRQTLPQVLEARRTVRGCLQGRKLLLRDLQLANDTVSGVVAAQSKFAELEERIKKCAQQVKDNNATVKSNTVPTGKERAASLKSS